MSDRKEYLKKYRLEHKEKYREYQRKYRGTHLSTYEKLQQENQKYKEVIDKVSSQIKLYGKYKEEKCTRGFSVMTADFNKLLNILKEVE